MAKSRNRDDFLEPTIIEVLDESPIPLKILPINFKVNEKTKRIVSLNAVKNQLKLLVEKKKVMKKDLPDASYYWTKRIS
ncbi:MAG: hypothetical protein QMD12_02065 [Candidatus Aenigmarchaeota archaeon]|nr:hypothetical protein [Candidatus Aenigmarchaeota archaeon]